MKTKNKKELFAKTIDELRKILSEKRQELFLLRQDLSQNKLKNQRSIFWKRKEIAQILTKIREMDLFMKKEELTKNAKYSGGRGNIQKASPALQKTS